MQPLVSVILDSMEDTAESMDVLLLALDLITESVLKSFHHHLHPSNRILWSIMESSGPVHVNLDGLELIVQNQSPNNQRKSIVQMEWTMITMG